jgi:hypothetical protein
MVWLNQEDNRLHKKVKDCLKDMRTSDLYGEEDEETE